MLLEECHKTEMNGQKASPERVLEDYSLMKAESFYLIVAERNSPFMCQNAA